MDLNDYFIDALNGSSKAKLTIIEQFKPTLKKFSNELNYNGSEEDLIVFLLELMDSKNILGNKITLSENSEIELLNTYIYQ